MIELIKFKDKQGEIQKGVLITSVHVNCEFPYESYKFIVYYNNSLVQLFHTIKNTDVLLGKYESHTVFDFYIEHLNCPDLDAYILNTPDNKATICY